MALNARLFTTRTLFAGAEAKDRKIIIVNDNSQSPKTVLFALVQLKVHLGFGADCIKPHQDLTIFNSHTGIQTDKLFIIPGI